MAVCFTYKFFKTTSEAWDAMYQAVLNAKIFIFSETFIFVDDSAGMKFVDIFCEKAKAGVKVILNLDGIGSLGFSTASLEKLRRSGVSLVLHNDPKKLIWYLSEWLNVIWNRTHRKLLIIDDEKAFLGGVNLRRDMAEWDDLHMMITGKTVPQLASLFARDYIRSGGMKTDVKKWLHPKRKYVGELTEKIKYIMYHPVKIDAYSDVKNLFNEALSIAKISFTLVTPYFVPDKNFIRLIAEAKQRGVKVNIVMPIRTDLWFMKAVTQAYYDVAVRAGATLYLLPKMNHAKAVQVDRRIGIVGSMNFTPRSFFHSRESGVVFKEEKMVDELNGILEGWKMNATVVDKDTIKKTSLLRKLESWFGRIITNYV